ncbi:hypothetical protein AArcMg_3228 [Natrarchaeobaculum sulfurireducens]|uniref:Uncharacterized protein n=1 Tax=Natrarchaeobaculum sulfurireducens TaxID=2044521 RepID=A0A346PUL8_9EURY|nr:hypothetical protein AArcMg_3228 [Natrarchaeobaculum sulfurireducens]
MTSMKRTDRWTTVTVECSHAISTGSVLEDTISYGVSATSEPSLGATDQQNRHEGVRQDETGDVRTDVSQLPDEQREAVALRNELRVRLGQVTISEECGNLVAKAGRTANHDRLVFDPSPVVECPPESVDRLLTLEFDPEDGTTGRLYERDGESTALLESYHGRPKHHATDVIADVYRDYGFKAGIRSNIDMVIRRADVAQLVRTGDEGVRLRAAKDCWEKHTYNVIENPSTRTARNVVSDPFDADERASLFEAVTDSMEPTVVRGRALKALAGHVLNPFLATTGSEMTDEAVEQAIAAHTGPFAGSFDLGIDPDQAETVLEIIDTWLEADTRDDRDDARTRDATEALWLSPHWDLYATPETRTSIWEHLDQLGVRDLVMNSAWDGTLFAWPYQ